MSGRMSHEGGITAEARVAEVYAARGAEVAASRWRGRGGEIDLIVRDGTEVVFVEVKSARDLGAAAARIGTRQVRRIFAAAAEFLAGEPAGQLTPTRFDAALVDARGRIEILPGALGA